MRKNLQWLGIDCLWLLPIYQSPLRDGGYDISDHTKILPEFGDLGDFVALIEAAHARGIRVECMGGVQFPAVGELPYLLTLPGHGFYWLQLRGGDRHPLQL